MVHITTVILAFASLVMATPIANPGGIPAGVFLPECGRQCMDNMATITRRQYGCDLGDRPCYCKWDIFAFGVRDCAHESCPSAAAADASVKWAANYCNGAYWATGAVGAI